MVNPEKVAVIGAGTIGLSIGWYLARAGVDVTLFERNRAGRGTSWAAAGMLIPTAEIGFEELQLYTFSRESLNRWPDFVRALEQDSGQSVDYRTEGVLMVADDADGAARLRRQYEFQKAHGCTVEWLTATEALEIEPFLAPRLAAAVFSPTDQQVDNRRLIDALKTAFLKQGGRLEEQTPIRTVVPDAQHPHLVTEIGDTFEADVVVVAAGTWSRQLEGLKPKAPQIRPVKGQMIQLQIARPFDLQHVVHAHTAYLAPKSDGRLLVGATTEEMGFDTTVTAGGLYSILEQAWRVVPGIYDLTVTDTWAGLRPASLDHAPILGPSGLPGVVYATGHYRHGILLTPITGREITRLIMTGTVSEWLQPFVPARFQYTIS